MIVGSLLLTIGAVALLLLGLVNGSDPYLVGSIAASLLAAITIVVGSRRAGAARARPEAAPSTGDVAGDGADDRITAERDSATRGEPEPMTAVIPTARVGADEPAVRDQAYERRASATVLESVIPAQGGAPRRGREVVADDGPDGREDSGDEEPPDEPVAQRVPPGDAARVAGMSNDVLVVDGRPRYHLAGCAHLLGRTSEALPVHEAVELGFTPCGLCEPDSALLADAGRG